jgi:DNA-binding response OmpR family regulator
MIKRLIDHEETNVSEELNNLPSRIKKILIIDDEENMCNLLKLFFLHDYGENKVAVFTSTSGLGGLKLSEKLIPQLVILDVGLKDMNGYDLYRRLKNNEKLQSKYILMSGQFFDPAFKIKILQKPINAEVLRSLIKTNLGLESKK